MHLIQTLQKGWKDQRSDFAGENMEVMLHQKTVKKHRAHFQSIFLRYSIHTLVRNRLV